VARDLRDGAGGFFSAEDADSVPPGPSGGPKKEGAFYVWSDAEIGALLGPNSTTDADIVRQRFGIQPDGNAPEDPQGEFTGQNLLYTARSIEEVAAETGRTPAEVVEALGRARQVLFDARARRPRPHLDDKVLTSWNGMMMAAFARAARVLPERPQAGEWLATAQRAATFAREHLWRDADATLLRRYRGGDAAIEAYAEDYACLIWGLLELFQADGDPEWLAWAIQLQSQQDARFWDGEEGGWFSTTGRDPSVLLRLKEDYDGAEPSASSVSVLNLLALAHLTGDEEARRKVARTLGRYGERAGRAARVIPMMLAGLSTWHAGASQIVVLGAGDGARALQLEAARHYAPFAVMVPVTPGDRQRALAAAMPFVGAMEQKGGRATAFVCRDFACREPVTTAEALAAQLQSE
jgi:uncharacterized protein YyaL (SSP411 family)